MAYYKFQQKEYATGTEEGDLNDKDFVRIVNFLNNHLPCFHLYGFTTSGQPVQITSSQSFMEDMALKNFITGCTNQELMNEFENEEIGWEDDEGDE